MGGTSLRNEGRVGRDHAHRSQALGRTRERGHSTMSEVTTVAQTFPEIFMVLRTKLRTIQV